MGFLALVARVTGKLKKGGIPNTDAAARTVLHDWNTGKIKYYCKPPAVASGGGAGEVDSKVLSAFSAEMDLDALHDQDVRVLDAIEASSKEDAATAALNAFVPMDSVGSTVSSITLLKPAAGARGAAAAAVSMAVEEGDDDGDDGQMEDDEASVTTAGTRGKPSAKSSAKKLKAVIGSDELPSADPRKLQKKLKKKTGKDQRRGQDAAYDFDNDFEY
jgi:nuclear GTP-binding protein